MTVSTPATPPTASVVRASPPARNRRRRALPDLSSDRLAFWAFAAYLVAAVPLLLWMGSYRWFFGDEWSFLAGRSVTLDDLFRAHNQHWSTIPVLVYRGMYSIFGLHTYLPYQLLVILLHVTTAALLRVVMRRAGVQPWIATVAAGSFVLLGAAEDNILWAFQIGFVGTLALGIGQTLLADHDGPIDRRDWYGLALGGVALTMSGQAPSLVLAAGLVCVFRGRWKAVAFHTVPLGVIYVAWYLLTDVQTIVGVEEEPFTFGSYVIWMRHAAGGFFMALGHILPGALALVGVLLLGLLVAWRADGFMPLIRRAAIPVAMAIAAIVSMSAAAPGRFFLGTTQSAASRYIGVVAVLTLPLLAVAAGAIAERWRLATPVVLALFLVPIPWNAAEFGNNELLTEQYFADTRAFVTSLPRHPAARLAQPWVQPNDTLLGQPDMTIGWLLQADRNGELPELEPLDPWAAGVIPLQLGIAPIDEVLRSADLRCTTHEAPLAVDPELGERWLLESPVQITLRNGDAPASLPKTFGPAGLEITLPDLQLLVSPPPDETEFELCR